MVETVGIITQLVHVENSILNPADSNLNIAGESLRGIEKPHPIEGRGAVPPVNEQDRPENITRVHRGLSQFVCRLQVHLFHGIFGVGLVLIPVYPGAGFYRGFRSHDLRRDRP